MTFSILPLGLVAVAAVVSTFVMAQVVPAHVEVHLAEGDTAAERFDSAKALASYLAGLQLQPEHVPLMLRTARQYRHLMAEATATHEKLKLGQLSLVYAKRAAALALGDSEAQLSPAISVGKMLPHLPSKEQVMSLGVVKKAADEALRLDPGNDNAWHVMGLWHRNLAGIGSVKRGISGLLYGTLPPSTYGEAVDCFAKAIQINPRRLRHHVELGITYAAMGKYEAARMELKAGLALPNLEKDDVELRLKGQSNLAALPP